MNKKQEQEKRIREATEGRRGRRAVGIAAPFHGEERERERESDGTKARCSAGAN